MRDHATRAKAIAPSTIPATAGPAASTLLYAAPAGVADGVIPNERADTALLAAEVAPLTMEVGLSATMDEKEDTRVVAVARALLELGAEEEETVVAVELRADDDDDGEEDAVVEAGADEALDTTGPASPLRHPALLIRSLISYGAKGSRIRTARDSLSRKDSDLIRIVERTSRVSNLKSD